VEKIKTYILLSIDFWESCYLWDNVEKWRWSQRGHRWQYNITQKRCDFHAWQLRQEYIHAAIILNTYCSSAASVVTWMHHSIILFIHCLYLS